MPEGPSIVILKEEVESFTGREVIEVSGNTKVDVSRAANNKVIAFKSWGKHFLICFSGFTIRIHFMLFGSYRINERKESPPRLSLVFKNGEINFYACSVKVLEGDINDYYNWSEDVMSEEWNPAAAKAKLLKTPDKLACDALLEQDVFSGVGNIIKNEVLYRIHVHPEARIGNVPDSKLDEMIDEARIYSFQFLDWKKV